MLLTMLFKLSEVSVVIRRPKTRERVSQRQRRPTQKRNKEITASLFIPKMPSLAGDTWVTCIYISLPFAAWLVALRSRHKAGCNEVAPRSIAEIVLQRDGVWVCPNAQMRLIGRGPKKQRCGSMFGKLAETRTERDCVWVCNVPERSDAFDRSPRTWT